MMHPDRTLLQEASQARIKPHALLQLPIFAAVFSVSQMLMSVYIVPLTIVWLFSSEEFMKFAGSGDIVGAIEFASTMPDWYLLCMLFVTVFETLAAVLYCVFLEKRPLRSMGFFKKGAFRQYAIGFLIGSALIGSTVGISVLTGQSTITFRGISFFTVGAVLMFLLGYMVQGAAEETLCRGYFMLSLHTAINKKSEKKWAPVVSVLVSALVFALLHGVNPGITPLALFNIGLFGVFIALYVLRTGNLWGACAIHTAWNFMLGNVLGVEVSGMDSGTSIFYTVDSGSAWINGGAFGLEGGIAETIVALIAILLVLFLPQKRKPSAEANAIPGAQGSDPVVQSGAALPLQEATAPDFAGETDAAASSVAMETPPETVQETPSGTGS